MLAHHFRQGTEQSADGLRHRSLEVQSGASPEIRQGSASWGLQMATGLEHNMLLFNFYNFYLCVYNIYMSLCWIYVNLCEFMLNLLGVPFESFWPKFAQNKPSVPKRSSHFERHTTRGCTIKRAGIGLTQHIKIQHKVCRPQEQLPVNFIILHES